MFELRVSTHFAAAHHLRHFKGKCEQLHGHNWKVEVFLTASQPDGIGLVRDFGEIKTILCEVINGLDHQNLNDLLPFREQNPTSEIIAQYLFDQLSRRLNDSRARVSKVTVWESETSCASFFEET